VKDTRAVHATPTFSAEDHAHMARALQLAGRGLWSTPPNPSVGCVLLDAAGKVVGEGWHERAGEPHAEVLALRQSSGRERGGTAYVTLEPCAHFGRTPPCIDALRQSGVRRVVVAMEDPNPKVAGAGVRGLVESGVEVLVGLLGDEASELNRGFVSRMSRGRPWVTIKLGASLDGRTALADGSSQWITGAEARADVQRLRARAGAVLTGIGTVLADDPALTVRASGIDMRGRRPLRVVCDANGRLPRASRVASDGIDTLVLTSACGLAGLQAQGIGIGEHLAIEVLPTDAAGRLAPEEILRRLVAREVNEVLVEAGARLAGSFAAAGLADEIVVYVAPTVLGDTARPSFELPQPLPSLAERVVHRFHDVRSVGADLRLTLRPREIQA
jgi:diaminohydroxyphosphoribosylaminopyrimidine deaminase/5-amino-6-(5-phosphoribosylamino)uracil reductase